MQPAAKFRFQRGIDAALALHPRQAHESLRYNVNVEMRLPAGAMTGMPLMACAFVQNHQLRRSKSGGEFLPDCVQDGHNVRLRVGPAPKSSNSFACFLSLPTHNSAMPPAKPSRFKSDIRIKKDSGRKVEPETQACAVPGCVKPVNASETM